ncbi:MAG: P-loop NTPase [Clostridia bacterium]|nr:P-loop NTPase [Clostridia bacterium]
MAEKIVIASGKGGAGKTSFTTGTALSLAKKGYRVLVIDFDIGQGFIDFVITGEYTSLYNWGDVIMGNCDIQEVISEKNSVSIISAPRKWNDDYTSFKIKNIICSVEDNYDYILFDSPAGVSGGFKLAAECADRAIVISTPDEICTKAAASAVNELEECGLTDIRLVINRFNKVPTTKGRYYNIDEVIDAVKVQLIGVVPEDKEISYASSTGFAAVKACPAMAAYGRIAERITGKKVPLVLTKRKKEKSKPKKAVIALLIILFILALMVGAIDYGMYKGIIKPQVVFDAVSEKINFVSDKVASVWHPEKIIAQLKTAFSFLSGE